MSEEIWAKVRTQVHSREHMFDLMGDGWTVVERIGSDTFVHKWQLTIQETKT